MRPLGDGSLTITRRPGVEHLQLPAARRGPAPAGHRPQNARSVDHDVVAAGGEVHRAAVGARYPGAECARDRAAWSPPPCWCHRPPAVTYSSTPPSTRSPPISGSQVEHHIVRRVVDLLDDLGVQLGGPGATPVSGSRTCTWTTAAPAWGCADRRPGDLLAGDGDVRALVVLLAVPGAQVMKTSEFTRDPSLCPRASRSPLG